MEHARRAAELLSQIRRLQDEYADHMVSKSPLLEVPDSEAELDDKYESEIDDADLLALVEDLENPERHHQ